MLTKSRWNHRRWHSNATAPAAGSSGTCAAVYRARAHRCVVCRCDRANPNWSVGRRVAPHAGALPCSDSAVARVLARASFGFVWFYFFIILLRLGLCSVRSVALSAVVRPFSETRGADAASRREKRSTASRDLRASLEKKTVSVLPVSGPGPAML